MNDDRNPFGAPSPRFVEAVGLWLLRRWGEYFAVIATCVFLPLEVYELTEKVTAFRLGALVINVAAVVWLLWSKRLFGLNGGGAAYRAEHSAESLLTVERAAHESDQSAKHNVQPQTHAAAPRGGRSDY